MRCLAAGAAPAARGNVVEADEVDVVAAAVFGDLEEVEDAEEADSRAYRDRCS